MSPVHHCIEGGLFPRGDFEPDEETCPLCQQALHHVEQQSGAVGLLVGFAEDEDLAGVAQRENSCGDGSGGANSVCLLTTQHEEEQHAMLDTPGCTTDDAGPSDYLICSACFPDVLLWQADMGDETIVRESPPPEIQHQWMIPKPQYGHHHTRVAQRAALRVVDVFGQQTAHCGKQLVTQRSAGIPGSEDGMPFRNTYAWEQLESSAKIP